MSAERPTPTAAERRVVATKWAISPHNSTLDVVDYMSLVKEELP